MSSKNKRASSSKTPVAIIMGSDSDFRVMKGAADTLKRFGIGYKLEVVSAHRTPKYMQEFAVGARAKGYKIIIAGAGGAAHLPGMVASLTTLPVIGVPVALTHLEGLDSLLSIAQMPKGVPVATMAIDNSVNAGLLAARILSLEMPAVLKKLTAFENTQRKKVSKANARLKKLR
ncbi:MAG: 5-(carboxyamino)imidazole ribonucleotide mutase [Bdellovibrionota bacterium]